MERGKLFGEGLISSGGLRFVDDPPEKGARGSEKKRGGSLDRS